MFDKPVVVIDIETDEPDQKAFKDVGHLAVNTITAAVAELPDGSYLVFNDKSFGRPEYLITAFMLDVVGCIKANYPDAAIVGHNFIRFDAPVIKRLTGIDLVKEFNIYDTLIMSKISEFHRNSHSLASYAEELGMEKLPLSAPMARCRSDVKMTSALFRYLKSRKDELEIPDNPYKLEFRVAEIIARQHERGVKFDLDRARKTSDEIYRRMSDIKDLFERHAPYTSIPASKLKMPPKVQFKKDGTPSSLIQSYVNKHGMTITSEGGKYYAVCAAAGKLVLKRLLPLTEPLETTKSLSIDSLDEIKKYLLSQGWRPTLWNKRRDPKTGIWVNTSPKLHDEVGELCPNLVAMKVPFAELIAEYYTLKNRQGVITGWIMNHRVNIDEKLCPDADTIGAVTHRFTHKIVANVPRIDKLFGREFRSLFSAGEGYSLVGWDASQLEARMEAHYTYRYDGGTYAKELLEGDIHTKNQKTLGFASRDDAKSFKYATTYGAQASKLASMFGWVLEHSRSVLAAFWANNEALDQLRKDCAARATDRGWVRGLDGRPIAAPLAHSALNRLLQSAGAITMKYAMVIADRDIRKEGIDAHGLIRYHDEEQWEVYGPDAERVGRIGVESIRKAGRYLKLNVPLDGEYKVGKTWADTH